MGSDAYEDPISTQPSIGFPLGLALLLIFLCFMSGLFFSCLHWNRIRSVLGTSTPFGQDDDQDDIEHASRKSSPIYQDLKKNQGKSSLTVLMPGDEMPKFIAVSCPRQPPMVKNILVQV
ncbi:uncharacterized protein At5g65660-like [Mercurialis annua]|uniref:uncharacterized protein At5g65660-like n=1 Tax=Mercurialis annua TaxID=3986 RepID=UPI00215F1147|nr:uncharacterized protein At5g65660-like [Mercurialis annua]